MDMWKFYIMVELGLGHYGV